MNLYYREYLTFIDAISNIGGVSNVIISIFFFINKIFNNYAIYSDSKELFNFSIKQGKDNKKKIKLSNLFFNNSFDSSKNSNSSLSIKEKIQNSNNIDKKSSSKIENKTLENNEINFGIENFFNDAYIKEKYYRNSISSIFGKKEIKNFNKRILKKREKLGFCEYFIYKISFGKIYSELQLYEYFRIKVVSIENLLNNYLKVNDLIKVNNIIND